MDKIHKLERYVQDIYDTDPREDKKRIEKNNGGLLADSYRWVFDNITVARLGAGVAGMGYSEECVCSYCSAS
jgi:hypothetical protein